MFNNLLSFGLSADVTVEKMADIEARVGSMSLSELQERRLFLLSEENQLMATQEILKTLQLLKVHLVDLLKLELN